MWTSHEITAGGLKIHYLRTGGGGPPLVLAHGATDNGGCWVRLATALADTFDVIVPDARGHGLSDAPEGDYSASTLGNDLASFIEALHLDRPLVGGHSMGANTTLALIANHPRLARATFLEDPVFRMEPAASTQEIVSRRARMREEAHARASIGHEGIVAQGRARNPLWDDVEFDNWATAKMQVRDAFFTAIPEAFDWQGLLGMVECPTLLVIGDPSLGAIVNPDAAGEAEHLCPTLEIAHIPGAGHHIRRDRFAPFLSEVGAFLARNA